MKKTTNIITVLFQLVTTFVVLAIIYLIYAISDSEEAEMTEFIGFFLFQPLFAAFFSALSIAMCFVVGLPIRFNNKFNQWWKTKPLIPVTGIAIGLLLLMLAFNPNVTEMKEVIINEEAVKKEVPNLAISVSGWFLTAFSLLHFYPRSLRHLFRQKS